MVGNVKILFNKGKKNILGKTKSISETIKIKSEILEERKNIEQKYLEIGKKYYELFGNKSCEELAPLCSAVFLSKANIKHLTKEINVLQKGDEIVDHTHCTNCGAKLDKNFMFCPKCGKKI